MTALKINSNPLEKSAIANKLRICCRTFCKLRKIFNNTFKIFLNQFNLCINIELGGKLSEGPSSQENEQIAFLESKYLISDIMLDSRLAKRED